VRQRWLLRADADRQLADARVRAAAAFQGN
jgi:hypothetical protein